MIPSKNSSPHLNHEDHEDADFNLEIDERCHECNISSRVFEEFFRKGITLLYKQKHLAPHLHGGTIKVFFVSDQAIRRLNQSYRNINKPTDVISLSYFEEKPFPGEDMVGEIFISIDTARRQAKQHGIVVADEALYLFVHGFLHIFGYDHEKKDERDIMFALQDEILGSDAWRILLEDLES